MARRVEYTISLKDLAGSKLDSLAAKSKAAEKAILSLQKVAANGSYSINVSLNMRGVTDSKIQKLNTAAAALHKYSNASSRANSANVNLGGQPRLRGQGGGGGLQDANEIGGIPIVSSGFLRRASVVAGAYAFKEAQMEILRTTADYERLAMAIKVASDNSVQGEISMQWIRNMSKDYGLPLRETAEGFKIWQGAMKGTEFTSSDARKMFGQFAKGFSAMGLGAEQSKLAYLALGQMMSKGTVQAEELRGQLSEHLPGAFQMMAKVVGVSTSELGKMMKKGEILSAEVLPKLAAEIDRAFGKTATENVDNLTNNMSRVASAWDTMLERMGKSETGFFTKTMKATTFMLDQFGMLFTTGAQNQKTDALPESAKYLDSYERQFIKAAMDQKNLGRNKEQVGDYLYAGVENKRAEAKKRMTHFSDQANQFDFARELTSDESVKVDMVKRAYDARTKAETARLIYEGLATLPASALNKAFKQRIVSEDGAAGDTSKSVTSSADRVRGRSIQHITINVSKMSEVNVTGVDANEVAKVVTTEVPKALLTVLNDANIILSQNNK
jgi:tape measure domain-containing protein